MKSFLIFTSILFVFSASITFLLHLYKEIRTKQYLSSLLQKQIAQLRQELSLLSNSINVLKDLSSRYFITLNENGFQELCLIHSALTLSINSCDELLRSGNISHLEEIIHYIYVGRGRGAAPSCLTMIIGDSAAIIQNWAIKTKYLLDNLTNSVENTSRNLQEICGSSLRQRKITSLMITEARFALESLA